MSKTTALVFEGGQPEGGITQQMLSVRYATCLDTIELLLSLPDHYGEVVLATNYDDLASAALQMGAIIHRTADADFHFGQVLQQLVFERQAENVLYLSGAGSPLLTREEFIGIAEALAQNEQYLIVNNVQSADIVGWTPGAAISTIVPPQLDNALGYALRREAKLPRHLMPHSVGVHFDIDTPTDIQMARLIGLGGERMNAAMNALPWELDRYHWLRDELAKKDRIPGIWLSGRIGGPVIQHINSNIHARLRVVSEERGMKSMGTEGSVCSFVGSYIDSTGFDGFFRYLEQSVDLALIDTRPLFAHFKLQQTDNDRFSSDLGYWEHIEEAWIRDFTKAASEARIPIILGGHTLILGGIWALIESIRQERRESAGS